MDNDKQNFVSNNETWYYSEVKKLVVIIFLCYVMHKSMDQINWYIYAFLVHDIFDFKNKTHLYLF